MRRIGWALTVAWVGGVLLITNGDMSHPLFDFIFLAPLACWLVGLGVAKLLLGHKDDSERP